MAEMRKLLNPATLLILAIAVGCSSIPQYTDGEVPFVPTPPEVIDRMFEMARVAPGDLLYDLGSGDGRIVIRAAKRFGIRAVGVEIDAELVEKARSAAFQEKVDHLVEFRRQDALTVDVSRASVVTLYMLPDFNAKLRPIFDRQLKPGARVVSHDFPVEGWVPDRVETVKGDLIHDHTIYLFQVR
jgi:SAM-dependent methyltransferase